MEPEDQPVGHARKVEKIVDELDEKVAREREEQGVPGNRSERRRAAGTRGSGDEPPD